jgi:hypothetical protein
MKGAFWALLGSTVATLVGCGHRRIVPGPSARRIAGAPTAAVATENGLRVSVEGADWHGDPEDRHGSPDPS